MTMARVILFLVTTIMAKHHHSTDPDNNFFGNVYVAIHSVVDDLFESVGLGTNFTNESNTKLLLTMHYDLSNIADKKFETFDDIQKIIKDYSNQSYFIYSFKEIEEDVTKLDTMVKEILNKNNFDVYRKIKGTQHKRTKDKTKVNDDKNTKVNSNPAFDDSKEFTEFVINFLAKVNNLTIQDFKKSSKRGRIAVPSKKNLKVWDIPSSPKYDLDSNFSTKIFRGSKTLVNSYPFIVSIHIMGEFTCSGCIIGRDLVITAASCLHIAFKNDFFENNLKSIYVRLGSDHATRDGETIPVENLYFHPEYEPKHLLNNLAILKLEKRIRFSKQQKRIRRILWDKTPGVLPNETKSIIILGWGATKKDQHYIQKHPKLRVGMLDVYNTEDCGQKYTKDFINKENFCAALNGTNGGSCNGDVGGPGIVGAVLMGVVSFGAPECGAVGTQLTVFTKLGYYVPWIESVMNAFSKINQTNYDIINTRRKSKDKSKPARNNKLNRDEEYPEEVRVLRDTLIELLKTDKSAVDDVIYGDLYDELGKYFKSKEQIGSKQTLISTENKRMSHPTTPKRMFELKIELEPESEDTISAHTLLYSTSVKSLNLRKPQIDSEYETDNDAVQNDYTDNYEQSSEEERGLSIEIPNTKKIIESKQDFSTYSENDSNQQTSVESSEYSGKIKDSFTRNRHKPPKMDADKMHTAPSIYFTGIADRVSADPHSYGDNVETILREGKGKQRSREVLMKHDQLSKHASSVLDEGRSLATKNLIINFDTMDRYVNYDKHKYKNKKPERTKNSSYKKSKDKSRSSEIKAESFVIQF